MRKPFKVGDMVRFKNGEERDVERTHYGSSGNLYTVVGLAGVWNGGSVILTPPGPEGNNFTWFSSRLEHDPFIRAAKDALDE